MVEYASEPVSSRCTKRHILPGLNNNYTVSTAPFSCFTPMRVPAVLVTIFIFFDAFHPGCTNELKYLRVAEKRLCAVKTSGRFTEIPASLLETCQVRWNPLTTIFHGIKQLIWTTSFDKVDCIIQQSSIYEFVGVLIFKYSSELYECIWTGTSRPMLSLRSQFQ